MKNKTKTNTNKFVNKVKQLDLNALQNIKIDVNDLLRPEKDNICKFVITDYDNDFTDNLTTIEYQLNEHSERKTIDLYKTVFYGYMVNSTGKPNLKERYIIEVGTKQPNFAKSIYALKLTKELININGALFPCVNCLVNYYHYDTGTINTYMLNAIE